jgi:hypothetical protein
VRSEPGECKSEGGEEERSAHVAFLAEGIRIRVGNVAVEVALGDFDLGLESVPQPTEERLGLGQDRREGRVDVVDAVVQALLLAEVLRLELTVIASKRARGVAVR